MKKWGIGLLVAITSLASLAQSKNKNELNTLLWQISGNGVHSPSYLFGTIHMICSDDAILSDSLKNAIKNSDAIYFEVDMDNLFEMLGVVRKMKMRNDTTLADLLDKADYEKVRKYFEDKGTLLPFSILETYKPLVAASMLMESGTECQTPEAMEEVIMKEAKRYNKTVKGLETMAYQMSIFDTIPYKMQALQLVKYVDDVDKGQTDNKEYDELLQAYKDQDLSKLEELTKSTDMGISNFTDILLYNRNQNWVEKLKLILQDKPVVVAVGAGHLPGDKGVINLLRKAGYTVKPVPNKVRRSNQI
ncbi:MAG: TraB/GumN family protein [Bacteroidetes bacterium]|nr:MAG: TraB/GumN family protein [Bacteroidota bacterium]